MGKVFRIYDITLHLDPDQLFDVLDLEGYGILPIRRIADSLLSLRGSSRDPHSFCLRHDVRLANHDVLQRLSNCGEKLEATATRGALELEQRLGERLESVSRAATETLELAAADDPNQLLKTSGGKELVAGQVQQAAAKVRLLDDLL